MTWFSGYESICRADVPLRDHVWYGIGGAARWFVTPSDPAQAQTLLLRCREGGVPWRVLGAGANVLVRDEGFDGAVFQLRGAEFERTQFREDGVEAAAGVDFPRLIRATLQAGWVGLETLAGVPGTVGGLVRMNAGGKYGQMAQYVREARLIDADGALANRQNAEIGFRYRHTDLGGCVVLSAHLRLERGDPAAALERHREIWSEKHREQPPVAARTAGCIFKNPPGRFAGKLLDECGLKGARVGGAEISPRHANFVLAHEGAYARDVIDLIRLARDRVASATGVTLELEVDIW